METKINIINLPDFKNADIQSTYIFDNDFRFEPNDNINIDINITVHVPIGEVKVTEYGTSQQIESKRVNKSCFITVSITDICYNINKNGITSRIINVELPNGYRELFNTIISSEIQAANIDFE
jgi:hypothetical protein